MGVCAVTKYVSQFDNLADEKKKTDRVFSLQFIVLNLSYIYFLSHFCDIMNIFIDYIIKLGDIFRWRTNAYPTFHSNTHRTYTCFNQGMFI